MFNVMFRVWSVSFNLIEPGLLEIFDRIDGRIKVLVGREDSLSAHCWASATSGDFFLRIGGGSTSLSSWIAIGGNSLVKSRNQNPNQKNEPTMIDISMTDGL